MKNLIDFIIKHNSWFVFLFYLITSCVMLFLNNPFQRHVYLTSANAVSAAIYGSLSDVTSYFYLHDINEDLQLRNAMLEKELVNLQREVNNYRLLYGDSLVKRYDQYDFVVARVINNSIYRPENYITINRGSADGILPEMGVVDQNGIVGKVETVGTHASRIISLLNRQFSLSCKIKGKDLFGSLVWDGIDAQHAVLEELPRHVKYHIGDTIVTSGYSAVFPEGIIVGVIEKPQKESTSNFAAMRIKLTTDFTQLSTVRAIKNNMKLELDSLNKTENFTPNN